MAKKKRDVAAQSPEQPAKKVEAPPAVIVECPPELGQVARQEWDRVAPHLAAANRLDALDRGVLAIYCVAYAAWLDATMTIQTFGAIIKSPNGYPIQSPAVSIANQQADIMIRIAAQFGFTPASRRQFPGNSKTPSWLLDIPTFAELSESLKPEQGD